MPKKKSISKVKKKIESVRKKVLKKIEEKELLGLSHTKKLKT